jgi:hypothetical protein
VKHIFGKKETRYFSGREQGGKTVGDWGLMFGKWVGHSSSRMEVTTDTMFK